MSVRSSKEGRIHSFCMTLWSGELYRSDMKTLVRWHPSLQYLTNGSRSPPAYQWPNNISINLISKQFPNTPDYSHCDRVSGDQLESCPANSLPSEKTPLPCLLCHCGEFYQAGHNYRHLPHHHRGEGPDIGDLVWHTAITADQDEGGGASLVRTESSLSYNFPQTLKLSSSSARQKVWQANSAQF